MSETHLHAFDIRQAAEGIIGNGSFTTDWPGFQFQENSTNAVINQLRFATSRTVRQSAIILASFNAVVGLVLAVGIFGDCYWAAKRADPKMNFRTSMYKVIGPLNIFPFVLAIGIAVQGTITAVEQAKGLAGLLILGCEPISQVMLPTIFIVPYIQFFFGMETTARAFRRRAFDSFGKWTVSACVVLVIVSLAATYAVARAVQPPNFCFASLFWFVQRYRVLCFALFTAIASSLFLGALITFGRLFRSVSGEVIERIAASRMVYYMCIGVITNSIVIPFFASLTFRDDMDVTEVRGNLSMAATVATNLSALTNGGLYIFLRACQSSNIGRKSYFEVDRERRHQTRKRQIRKSPMTQTYTNQMEQPVSPPARVFLQYSPTNTAESQIDLAQAMGTRTSPSPASPPRKNQARKASYSVFPQQTPELNPKPLSVLPAVTYTPPTKPSSVLSEGINDADLEEMEIGLITHDLSSLLPPPAISGFMPGHLRDSSMGLSATVQIGLRLSNVNDMALQDRAPSPRPASSIYPQSIIGPPVDNLPPMVPPMPLNIEALLQGRTTARVGSKVWVDPGKQLPPVPLHTSKKDPQVRESRMLLSPLVYSPEVGGTNSRTGTVVSESDRGARMSPGSATEKRPSEWI